LWGNNYYDAEGKKWKYVDKSETGKQLKRAFSNFIMDPIIRLAKAIDENKTEVYSKMIEHLEIKLTHEEKVQTGKTLMRIIFQKWIFAADALLDLIIKKLPSPI
jgi:elongation factor 2